MNCSRRTCRQEPSFRKASELLITDTTETMLFTVYMFLLLTMAWPVSCMSLFCQNTRRQTENILNSLQTIRSATTGTNTADVKLTKLAEDKSILNAEQMCGLAQKLTNYQACDLSLSTEIKKKVNYTKIETKGLVDNMQMNSKNFNCVLSSPVCPASSNLALWNKINFLVDSWFQDVAAYSSALQSVCSNPTEKPSQL